MEPVGAIRTGFMRYGGTMESVRQILVILTFIGAVAIGVRLILGVSACRPPDAEERRFWDW